MPSIVWRAFFIYNTNMKNKKLILPKTTTLVNVGNSILNHYGVPAFHDTFKPLDDILSSTKKEKICLILFDALGKAIIEKHNKYLPFIYSHKHIELQSVYPPTTVAATIALTTGKYPCETLYLGWNQFFNKYNDFIDVFPMKSKINEKIYPQLRTVDIPVSYIRELINKYKKENIATSIHSFNFNEKSSIKDDLNDYFAKTNDDLKNYSFIYSYCTQPDSLMHHYGIDDNEVISIISFLDTKLKELVSNNPDTLFLLIADHGMIDTKEILLSNDKLFQASLNSNFLSLEGRFAGFFVKNSDNFIEYYNNNLSNDFIIKTKKEIVSEHTFGYGIPHKDFDSSLGDFFLIAKNEKALNDGCSPNGFSFKASHAGVNKNELELYLTIFNE